MQKLTADDRRPAYLQVAAEIRSGIEAGVLLPGDQLPTHRELAQRHGVAVETVKRALEVLRNSGHIVSRQGKGSFVGDRVDDDSLVLTRDSDPTEVLVAVRAELGQVQRRLAAIEARLDALTAAKEAE